MSEFLQVRIEFLAGEAREEMTPESLSDSVRSIFLEAGIDEDAVSTGVEEVSLREVGPLGIDPGTAAVVVGLLGMSVQLIKLWFDLEMREKELAIKERELDFKEQEKFVNHTLLVRLREQHDVRPTGVTWRIEER